MNKKLLYSIIVVILAIATIIVGTLLIFKNTGDFEITIGKNTALAGDVVKIPITVNNNSGVWGGQIIIDYDYHSLSFLSIEGDSIFDECQINDTGECVAILVTQSELKDTKKDGEIAVLNFKVKTSSKKGKQKISFNSETNFCNSDEELVEPILTDGYITVK